MIFARFSWCLFYVALTSVVLADPIAASPYSVTSSGYALTLKHETVSDNVDYSPNLPTGGFADSIQKPRFQSSALTLSRSTDSSTRYHLTVAQRQMNSLRDAFVINQLSGGLTFRLRESKARRYTLDVGLNASANHASEIYKNSYTSYADHLITEVRLVEPRDARLSVSADLAVSLSHQLSMNLSLSGGLSQTSQKEVVGSAQLDNDCQYAFNASSQGGSVRQVERCGNLVSYEQRFPNNETLNERLGFSVADDVTYRDYFFGPRLSLNWQRGAWSLGAGYGYRQYFRPTLDKRMRDAGDIPVSRSHNAFASASVHVLRHWQLSAQMKYQQAAFLDDVPFLYTALTHDRYRGKGVLRYALTVTRYFD